MYKLRPLFKTVEETPIPPCIYKMRRISDHFTANQKVDKTDPEAVGNDLASEMKDLQELEERWNAITSRLEKLQSDLLDIRSTSCPLPAEDSKGQFEDVVIRASPSRPPRSLPLVVRHLEEKLGVKVYASTHVHSTASSSVTDQGLKRFLVSGDQKLERSKAQLVVTLIWVPGNEEEPTMMVSPAVQTVPIRGECNIVRYLVRLLPGLLDYESCKVRAAKLDQLLDLAETCGPLGVDGSRKDRAAALQSLEKLLPSTGQELTVVDFVLYSALVNSGVDKEAGKVTRALMDRCRAGTGRKGRADLERHLTELGITFSTVQHPAVFTVAELLQHTAQLPGTHAKNLLVKDKKSGRLFLVTARHDAPVQLNNLAKLLGAKELRFADADALLDSLGVQQGSVTPFALMNDSARHVVTLVLDEQLWKEDGRTVNFHPLTNEATTSVTVSGLKTFLKATGHEPVIVQL